MRARSPSAQTRVAQFSDLASPDVSPALLTHHLPVASHPQLTSAGINPQCISFTNLTMESEKFICVRETGVSNSVVIVDMANPLQPMKRCANDRARAPAANRGVAARDPREGRSRARPHLRRVGSLAERPLPRRRYVSAAARRADDNANLALFWTGTHPPFQGE